MVLPRHWQHPPDQVYEFIVITDTIELGFPSCEADQSCTFTEGRVPYKLGTLTLTHQARREHTAQLTDETNPPTDDGRVVSFTVAKLPDPPGLPVSLGAEAPSSLSIPATNPFCPAGYTDRLFQTIPPCSFVQSLKIAPADGYTLDLTIVGEHLSGTIDIVNEQPHGVGCSLDMQGSNNNWSGTWNCTIGGGGPKHSFTAISIRAGGHVAQR